MFGVDAGVGGMVCGRVCVMVWGICFGVGVLRGVLCRNGNGVWIADATPSPALSRTTRELFQSRCGRWRVLQGRGWKVGCSVVGLGCVFGRCSVGCGVQKRQWCLDCCLYPLPNPPPLRASPCRGGSGSAGNVVRLSVRGCGFCPDRPYVCRVTRFALTQPAPLFALAFIHTLERSRCM